jgi:hypothetical protein
MDDSQAIRRLKRGEIGAMERTVCSLHLFVNTTSLTRQWVQLACFCFTARQPHFNPNLFEVVSVYIK